MNFSMFGKDVLLKTDEDSSPLKIILLETVTCNGRNWQVFFSFIANLF